jgi:hypothetical protein
MHLRDILHLQISTTDQILTEVQKAILFLQEAVWRDRAIHQGPLPQVLHLILQVGAADRPTAAAEVHIRPDLHLVPHLVEDLHQAVVVVPLQAGDSQKQYYMIK